MWSDKASDYGSRGRVQLRNAKGQFSSGKTGVEWVGLQLLDDKYREFGNKMHEMRIATADKLGEVMEEYAKAHAPWEDRTGDARESLHANVVHEATRSTVYLGHGEKIYYGYFLENYTYSGVSYAIIGPTIRYFETLVPSMMVHPT